MRRNARTAEQKSRQARADLLILNQSSHDEMSDAGADDSQTNINQTYQNSINHEDLDTKFDENIMFSAQKKKKKHFSPTQPKSHNQNSNGNFYNLFAGGKPPQKYDIISKNSVK